jgi:hypothetical protein
VTAALGPLLGQLVGLPGAPVRVTQVAVTSVQPGPSNGISFGGPVLSGRPPVFDLPLAGVTLPGEGNASGAQFTGFLRVQYGSSVVNDLVGLPPGAVTIGVIGVHQVAGPRHAAQFAVAQALERVLKLTAPPPPHNSSAPGRAGGPARGASPSPAQLQAAVDRFAALPAAMRHAWLATHLTALRAGRITLSEIP